jgi:hypothetical protein
LFPSGWRITTTFAGSRIRPKKRQFENVSDGCAVIQALSITEPLLPGCFVSFFVTEPVWLACSAGVKRGWLEKPVRSEVLLDAVNG